MVYVAKGRIGLIIVILSSLIMGVPKFWEAATKRCCVVCAAGPVKIFVRYFVILQGMGMEPVTKGLWELYIARC